MFGKKTTANKVANSSNRVSSSSSTNLPVNSIVTPKAVPAVFSESDAAESEVFPADPIEEFIVKDNSNRQLLEWKAVSQNEIKKSVESISEAHLDVDYVMVKMKAAEMLEIPSLTRIIGCNSICTIYKR